MRVPEKTRKDTVQDTIVHQADYAMNFRNGGDDADQEARICGPCKQKAGARPPPRKRPQEAAQLCGLEQTPKVRWKAMCSSIMRRSGLLDLARIPSSPTVHQRLRPRETQG